MLIGRDAELGNDGIGEGRLVGVVFTVNDGNDRQFDGDRQARLAALKNAEIDLGFDIAKSCLAESILQ